MSNERLTSLGVSLVGSMMVAIVARNTYSMAPQVFLVSAVAGFIFGVISSLCINFRLPKLGHFIYPLGIGFSAITSLDMFGRLHGSIIGNWEFFQNRVISNVGAVTGFTAGFLLGHVALNCQG
jgi:hypothetical protein